jgi:predicted permease
VLSLVFTLGLGIAGVSTSISVTRWILWPRLPGVPEQDALVRVTTNLRSFGGSALRTMPVSQRMYDWLHNASTRLNDVATVRPFDLIVAHAGNGLSDRLSAELVSSNYLEVVRVPMLRGQGFASLSGDEDRRIVVVSSRLWSRFFPGEPETPGRTLLLNSEPFVVTGIAYPGYHGVSPFAEADLWVPAESYPFVLPELPADVLSGTFPLWPTLVARLSESATIESARSELDALLQDLYSSNTPSGDEPPVVPQVEPAAGLSGPAAQRVTRVLTLLSALGGMLLFSAVANTSFLLGARATWRTDEFKIRYALGASRADIARDLMTEATAVIGLGALFGFLVTRIGLLALEQYSIVSWLPPIGSVPIDWTLYATLAVTSLPAAAIALATFARAAGIERAASSGTAMLRSSTAAPVRRAIVGPQFAFSITSVIVAGVLWQSLVELRGRDLGVEPASVLFASVEPGRGGYEGQDLRTYYTELLDELSSLPGVASVAITRLSPFGTEFRNRMVTKIGGNELDGVLSDANLVTESFFGTLGIGLQTLRPEAIAPAELGRSAGIRSAILNRTLANILFPDGSPVGRPIRIATTLASDYQVIAVADDNQLISVLAPQGPVVYEIFGQAETPASATVAVRTTVNPLSIVGPLREAVRGLDPDVVPFNLETLSQKVEKNLTELRFLSRASGALAAIIAIVGAAGLLSLLSFDLARRMRELALRAAVGATAATLGLEVLRQLFRIVAPWLAIGLFTGWAVARWLASQIMGVQPPGMLLLATSGGLVVASGLIACVAPLFRATRPSIHHLLPIK